MEVAEHLAGRLRARLGRDASAAEALEALRGEARDLLAPCEKPLDFGAAKPFVVLLVGVNGAGKTTLAGKLAALCRAQGKTVMLAAGDTFRAAAIDQLQVWGERVGAPVVAQQPGADSAAVIYDAAESARAKNIDVLIADTAGRLHNKEGLMRELGKVRRTLAGRIPGAPHETLLVVDAHNGQNALIQAREFHKTMGLTGVAVTKLDGTAKGGVMLAVARELELPIRFISVGESLEDLVVFEAAAFAEALIPAAEDAAQDAPPAAEDAP